MVDKITSPITPLGEINKINEIIDNLGSGVTVDQTYNASSANAQSGVAIAGAGFLKNTATGNNALTIGGTAATTGGATNIGKSAIASKSYSTAVGYNSQAKGNYSSAVGWNAMTTKTNAIQIGYGTNTTQDSLAIGFYNVGTYLLLDGATGKIPSDRIKYDGTTISVNSNGELTSTGSGASRNIGEIVASTIPLTDAGLHLLDGTLISGSGSYSAFVTYIAGLVSTHSSLFTTESAWQTAVSTYGVCGKFVYNSTNNTVRLPKYNSKIYTGGGTAPVVGNGMSLGLYDGTNNFTLYTAPNTTTLVQGVPYGGNVGASFTGSGSSSNKLIGVTSDPTKSGLIAQLSDITTSLDGYYYIVVATSTKTDIQVDIDEIATDLNGKADVDLSNCTKPHIVETYKNGTSWYRVYSDGWCEQGGSIVTTSANPCSVTLLKPFVDTNYMVWTSQIDTSGNQQNVRTINTKTTSNFTFWTWSVSGINTFWQACGYIR